MKSLVFLGENNRYIKEVNAKYLQDGVSFVVPTDSERIVCEESEEGYRAQRIYQILSEYINGKKSADAAMSCFICQFAEWYIFNMYWNTLRAGKENNTRYVSVANKFRVYENGVIETAQGTMSTNQGGYGASSGRITIDGITYHFKLENIVYALFSDNYAYSAIDARYIVRMLEHDKNGHSARIDNLVLMKRTSAFRASSYTIKVLEENLFLPTGFNYDLLKKEC